MDFDIALIGLGAMGSAAARALSMRGVSVIAFDRFRPPHQLGSTHGHTRIIREAYYEHPLYVPLVRRAYELWGDIERESGQSLLRTTGGLMVGRPSGPLVAGASASARQHGIEHEVLGPSEMRSRFPAFAPRADWVGLLERRAGVLFPERCVSAMLAAAGRHGATLRLEDEVLTWQVSPRGVRVSAASGEYGASILMVAAGPWLPQLAPALGRALPLEIERQLSHWFAPRTDVPGLDELPIALWEVNDAGELFATFPHLGHGVKCGMHHSGAPTSPGSVDRIVRDEENDAARSMLESVIPGAGGALREARVCLYTNTPDRHFILDWLQPGRVLVASPCSGHGFKFAPAIGELMAQLALGERPWLDLTPFSLSRFG